jgi:predicted ferric reductase
MTQIAIAPPASIRSERGPAAARVTAWTLWLLTAAGAGVVVWIWLHGGGVGAVATASDGWTSAGRLTGLVAVYLSLVQVLLLARLPPLERLVGFDRLTVWHRVNGKLTILFVIAHVVAITIGYAGLDRVGVGPEISRLLSDYPGMIAATVGTAIMLAVVASSIAIARRRLPYEAWYVLHISVYAGIALAYVHQIPTGNDLTANAVQRDFWIALYVLVLSLLAWFRLLAPARAASRHRLRVQSVVTEAPGIHSIVIAGRGVERIGARGGQFMSWRFLDRSRWWQAHPFSLSRPPGDGTLRITVKEIGGFTASLASLRPGTRVVAEGPFGRFTAQRATHRGVLMIAGGIGLTPIRAILDELPPSVERIDVIHRVLRDDELIFGGELAAFARERGATVHRWVGDHRDQAAASMLSPERLRAAVPAVAQRDVFVCGPPGMMDRTIDSLRALGVPREQIHSERFALAA